MRGCDYCGIADGRRVKRLPLFVERTFIFTKGSKVCDECTEKLAKDAQRLAS